MENVPLCRFATSHHLYFYTKWGGLNLDCAKGAICRSGAPHHPDIRNGRGPQSGRVREGAVSSASEGFYTLGGFCFLISIQELLGHKGVKTTMVYTQVLNRGLKSVRSPRDEV